MSRGALIFPMLVDVARLDKDGTAWDPVYREPVVVPSGDKLGTIGRAEETIVQLQAQLEPEFFNRLAAAINGNGKSGRFTLVFHFMELEDKGLISPTTGLPLIGQGDRIAAVRKLDGTLVYQIPNPPGLFVEDATPSGWLNGERNLLITTCSARRAESVGFG